MGYVILALIPGVYIGNYPILRALQHLRDVRQASQVLESLDTFEVASLFLTNVIARYSSLSAIINKVLKLILC